MRSAGHKLDYSPENNTAHCLQFRSAATAALNRRWPVTCSAEKVELELAQNGRTTPSKQPWGGADSPVSVIGHTSMMMQGSNPSSGSASMEHPSSSVSSTHHHQYQYPLSSLYHHSFSTELPPPHPQLPEESAAASDYAELLSERVQQAFRKSHELQPHVVKKTWPPNSASHTKRMEWLNLQEDPSFTAGNFPLCKVYRCSRQSRTDPAVAGRKDQYLTQENIQGAAAVSSEEERLSITYSSTKDRQEELEDDEESVIDFFPSAEYSRPSLIDVGNLRERTQPISRRSGCNGRSPENDQSRRGSLNRRSSCIRSAPHHHHDTAAAYNVAVDESKYIEGGRVSTSYKWDDAERWLTSPTRAASSAAPPPPPPPALHQPPFSNSVDLHGLAKGVSSQVQPRKPLSEQSCTQDKHVPVNGGSHGFLKEAGTELRKDIKRDIATQSTPAEWSRCDSPEAEEPAILSSTAEKPSAERQQLICDIAQKTSPPRHNTPARRSVSCTKERGSNRNTLNPCEPVHFNSGKLNLLELESCHLEKLKLARDLPLGTSSTWLLFAEEESPTKVQFFEERPPHQQQAGKVNMLEARVSAWEDVERAKHLAKFKREQAKIEAWESLQRAEADAELRKLEVKLEKMRFEGREKIMGKLGAAQRRAQEMHSAAEAQKVEQLTRIVMRANQIRKSGHLPSSTFNVMCSLTTKIKPTSNLSFS